MPSSNPDSISSSRGWPGRPLDFPASSTGYAPIGGPAPANDRFVASCSNYDGWTRQSVFFFPVTLRGVLLGYLYASVTHNSAGFLRNLPAQIPEDPFSDPSWRAVDPWDSRLEAAYARGLTAQQAVRSWVGAPEDPRAGGIAADAVGQRAETLETLNQWVNPGGQQVPNPLIQDGTFPDGTPADRSEGWGPLVGGTVARYSTETASAVRFSPVMKDGQVIGFVWASVTGDAADYLRRIPAGRVGEIAAGMWQLWLGRALEAGIGSLQALDFCRGQPEDRLSGVIGQNAPVGELPSLAQLKAFAQQ